MVLDDFACAGVDVGYPHGVSIKVLFYCHVEAAVAGEQ